MIENKFDIRQKDTSLSCLMLTGIMCFPCADSFNFKKNSPRKNKYLKMAYESKKENYTIYPETQKHIDWMLRSLLAYAGYHHNQSILKGVTGVENDIYFGALLGKLIHGYGGWSALAEAAVGPGQKDGIIKDIKDSWWRGVYAGWMLKELIHDNSYGGVKSVAEKIASPDFKKQLAKRVKDSRIYGSSSSPKKSNKTHKQIEYYFRLMRPSAHLWAAYLVSDAMHEVEPDSFWFPLDKYKKGGLKGFLQIADVYREAASKRFPHRGPRRPIVTLEESWQIIY